MRHPVAATIRRLGKVHSEFTNVRHDTALVGVSDAAQPWFLSTADDVLFVFGAVVVFATVLVWAMRSRRDPLARAPERLNRLMPEGVLAPLLAWMLAGSTLTMLVNSYVGEDHRDAAMIWAGNVSQMVGTAACMWAAVRFFEGGINSYLLGNQSVGRQIAGGFGCFLAASALCPLVLELTVVAFSHIVPEYQYFEHEIVDALRQGKAPLVTLWIGTVIVAPIAEECFFRGIVQTYLEGALRSRWIGVCATAAVFGAIHAGGGDTPQPHVVPALTMLGVMLGALYVRTGSLLPPIILHVLFNAKTLVWETLSRGGT